MVDRSVEPRKFPVCKERRIWNEWGRDKILVFQRSIGIRIRQSGEKGFPDGPGIFGGCNLHDGRRFLRCTKAFLIPCLRWKPIRYCVIGFQRRHGSRNARCNRRIYAHRGGCSYQRFPGRKNLFLQFARSYSDFQTVSDLLPGMLIEDVEFSLSSVSAFESGFWFELRNSRCAPRAKKTTSSKIRQAPSDSHSILNRHFPFHSPWKYLWLISTEASSKRWPW